MKLADLTTIVQWGMFLAGVALVILACSACGGTTRPLPDAPAGGAGAELGFAGTSLVWIGAICSAAGLVLSLLSLAYPALKPFAAIFGVAWVGGFGISVTGAAYIWIANHYWWVLVIAAVVGVGISWWFWPRIHRAIDRRLNKKV
jgi:hypothetical protein